MASDSKPQVVCRVCGTTRQSLTSHVRTAHSLSTSEYLRRFPGARLAATKPQAPKPAPGNQNSRSRVAAILCGLTPAQLHLVHAAAIIVQDAEGYVHTRDALAYISRRLKDGRPTAEAYHQLQRDIGFLQMQEALDVLLPTADRPRSKA